MGTVITMLIFAACAPARTDTAERLEASVKEMVSESRSAAAEALEQLEFLATKENFKSLGFDALDEVKRAELGPPLPVIIVKLDELRDFKEGDDPFRILHPIGKVVYMVNVNGETRCGVEVEKQDDKWEVAAVGITGPAREYVNAIKAHIENDQPRTFFIIKVPALNQIYLAYQTERGARLVSVRQQNDTDKKVESRPPADVLWELVKSAKEHDGSFR
jgi:hypothetical protein